MQTRHTARVMAALATGSVLGVLAVQFAPTAAQPVKHVVLGGAQATRSGECIELTVVFNVPVQYLSSAPQHVGPSLYIDVEPRATGPAGREGTDRREAVRVQSDEPLPIIAVVYDGTQPDPRVVIDLDTPMAFSVRQGEDFRSLAVRMAPPGSIEACAVAR